MKGVTKKLLCMLLTAVLVLGLVPMTGLTGLDVQAATPSYYTDDPSLVRALLEENADVTIKLSGDVKWERSYYWQTSESRTTEPTVISSDGSDGQRTTKRQVPQDMRECCRPSRCSSWLRVRGLTREPRKPSMTRLRTEISKT